MEKKEKKILFIDACVRKDSRTRRLAEALLARLGGSAETIFLEKEALVPLSEAELAAREEFIRRNDYSDPMFRYAKRLTEADEVVVAAPYWDLSFPSSLRVFIERIAVRGLTFTYSEDGSPLGLCRAERLWYVTTMGGAGLPHCYGFGYLSELFKLYYGVPEARLAAAEGLDIAGCDPEAILDEAIERIRKETL